MRKTSLSLILLIIFSVTAIAQVKFDVQGHRGARGLMPENTIPAMIKGLEMGVTTLEMDVVITKDRKAVVSHEPYFNHETTTTPAGKTFTLQEEKQYNIFQMTYDQVSKFDVGQRIHPRFPGQQKIAVSKPLLSDLLDSTEAYVRLHKLPKPQYNIETKTIRKGDKIFQPDSAEYVELIMKVVMSKKLEQRVTIQSFDIRTLQYLHKKYPKIRTSLLIEEKEEFENNIKQLGFLPTYYSPYSVLVGKSLVDRCHAAGVKIIPWTVNTAREIIYLMNLGVDGIITDYPNLMKVVKEEMGN